MAGRARRPVLFVFVLAATLFAAGVAVAAPGPPSAVRGQAVLEKKGCVACHSTDGTRRVGPSFRELFASKRRVVTGGAPREVVADDEYIARSLSDPDADLAEGFPRTMPRFDLPPDDVASIVLALRDMSGPMVESAGAPRTIAGLGWLALASAGFVLVHIALSSIGMRKKLIAALGQRGFSAGYSIIVAVCFVGMIVAFRASPYVEVWAPPRVLRWVPVLFMPVVVLFMVAGFSTKSATSVGQAELATKDEAVRGIFSITRHPALCGFAIWGLSHLCANGELRAVIVFLSIVSLAIAGMFHIDARRAAALGESWKPFAERTSRFPFAAIAAGRAKLDLRGIGVVRFLIAVFFYTAILHTHAITIGASPMP